IKTNENVAIFSLEMGAAQLVQRMLCAEGNIDSQRLRTGKLEQDDWGKLTMAMGSLSHAGIYIDDAPRIRVSDIRSKCRRLKQYLLGYEGTVLLVSHDRTFIERVADEVYIFEDYKLKLEN